MDTALTLLAVALILLPGWALWWRLTGGVASQEVALTGVPVALSLAMVALYLCSYLDLAVFVVVWCAALLWALYVLRAYPPRIRIDRTLALLALGVATIRFLPALVQEFPPGWDPYFHLLVVRLIEQSGAHVSTLSPFEDIPINYPLGTHLLVALVAKYGGASIYGAFQAILVLFGTLTCLQVYAWVQVATGNRRWALYAMAAYGFLAVQGSLDYYAWGGLPNLLGMYALAGCLTLIAQRDAGERRWWVLPPMYLAIALCNHHVLMTAFAVLLVLLLWLVLDPQRRSDARRLAAGGAAAALIAAPYLAYRFLSTGEDIYATGLLTFVEPPNTIAVIVFGCGVVFSIAVVAGAALYARAPRAAPMRTELLLPALVMLALFGLFEFGSRALMLALYGHPIAPFTPSRFVTDAVAPLSAFAGLAFLRIEQRIGRSVLPVAAALFLTNLAQYEAQFKPPIEPDRLAAYRWVEANTHPDTLVIDNSVHAPVLTNRASSRTALPSSELSGKAYKGRLLSLMQTGEVAVESTPFAVVLLAYGELPALVPPSAVLWQRGQVSIVDVNPNATARPRTTQ